MTLKQNIITIILILACISTNAQRNKLGLGLIEEDEKYSEIPQIGLGMNFSYVEIPQTVSLKKHCPKPGYQGEKGSCVGWASGYAAITILNAIKQNTTDTDLITKNANSAAYIYNQIKIGNDCNLGSTLSAAMKLLKEKGDCLKLVFPENDCNFEPNDKHNLQAFDYRLKYFGSIFPLKSKAENKIATVKLAIQEKKPVVIGLVVDEIFQNLKEEFYKPDENNFSTIGGHAICVIGFDDKSKSFELINSYGVDWGNDGFFKISYEDFGRYCKYAYKMELTNENEEIAFNEIDKLASTKKNNRDNKTNDGIFNLSGEFEFKKYIGSDNGELRFQTVKPNVLNGEYHFTKGEIIKGDYFRLFAKNINVGSFVYVFSLKPNSDIEILYPQDLSFNQENRNESKILPVVTSQNVTLSIPNGNSGAMAADLKGTDYLCILYASKEIENIQEAVKEIQKCKKKSFYEKLAVVFKNKLIAKQNLKYSAEKMKVNATNANGYIAPIILKAEVN